MTPHFTFPFAAFKTVEQDSDADIQGCVTVIASTPVGSLLDEPEFGIPNPVFAQLGADTDADWLVDAVSEWEPRAASAVAVVNQNAESISLAWKGA